MMTKEHSQQIRALRANLKKNVLQLDQLKEQISTDRASLLTLISGVQVGDVLRFHKEPSARLPDDLRHWWKTGTKCLVREISFYYPSDPLSRNPRLSFEFVEVLVSGGGWDMDCSLLLSELQRFFTKVKSHV